MSMITRRTYLRGSAKYNPYADTRLTRVIRSMQRQIRANRPEYQCFQLASTASVANATATVLHLTGIAQGDDSDTRTGKKITVKGVDIRGYFSDRLMDIYLVKSKSGVAPVYADFQTVLGGHILDDKHFDYKQVAYIKPMQANTNAFRYNKRFKGNQNTHYGGAAAGTIIENGWYLVFKNNTGAAVTIQYSINLWYTDA